MMTPMEKQILAWTPSGQLWSLQHVVISHGYL
jgi:hypothetical protein